MQTTLEHNFGELRERVRDSRERAARAPRELYPLLAVELEDLAEESFLRRSHGSPDAGITWDRLTQRTLDWKRQHGYPAAIGVADGTLLGSLSGAVDPAGFGVGFDANFAGLFDARRQLLPDSLPDEWRGRLERTAEAWLDQLLSFD